MHRPARLIPLLLVTALALVGLGWWLGRQEPASDAARGPAATGLASSPHSVPVANTPGIAATLPAAEPRTAASAGAAPLTPPPAPEPLPPPDTAVTDYYDELLARAQSGDPRAACRLATELQRCQRAAEREGLMPNDATRMIAGARNDRMREGMIDMVARMEEERDRAQQVCTDLSAAQLDQAFALQLQAAQADPRLRVWAALQPALDQRYFVNDLEQWQQYRQVALPWLEHAAAEGDLTAVVALARVHGDGRRNGPRTPPLRQIDEPRSLIYSTLMERYGIELPPVQNAAEQTRARLDPAQLAEVDRRVTELFRPESVLPPQGREQRIRAVMRRSFEFTPPATDCE